MINRVTTSFFRVCATTAIALLSTACGSGSGPTINPTVPPPPPPPPPASASVARMWNEVLLEAIRDDFARPTVHARNLFHMSAATYDAWAAYASSGNSYLFGRQRNGFSCAADAVIVPADVTAAQRQAISFAMYRMLVHRFAASPGAVETTAAADTLMQQLGFDTSDESIDYQGGSAAALGNYIADCYIQYGLQDGSNEANDYANNFYDPVNPEIAPRDPGNPDIVDLDRWQPITVPSFIDQSGNEIENQPPFLSPEWGQVHPFALQSGDKTTYRRGGFDYEVYFDPGAPPSYTGPTADDYKWGFALVAVWSSHLDAADGVMIDISPASIGNVQQFPTDLAAYDTFYDFLDGGDASQGYAENPVTGMPYAQQLVPRGDYARVLAEFWADGPDSETPPGHWFVILNEVNDHPQLTKRIEGQGGVVDDLEWDVKAYFALGGTMHDAAIAAWGIKGWYDYVRPLSAIRAMADRGQSSTPAMPSYDPDGLPLVPDYIELVEAGDPLEGANQQHVGKIKLRAWRGPKFIANPRVDVAGVEWILAEEWWPYQRPSFVTPPFAGYVSGHSTYSRAAAEVLTAFTGDAYFPGGMSGFDVEANEFLVFEDGPSVGMTLQWATYRDASDQCSLSRIWGGIHPPADDLRGRLIGEQIGIDAFAFAKGVFDGTN